MDKFTIVSRIRELNKASEAYYNTGQPIMSDTEFDQKLRELQEWEEATGIVMSNSPTQNVGVSIMTGIPKVIHKTPMLSLDKCHSTEEIIKFANNHNLVGSIKLDGISCRLVYDNGNLIRAESRGNGTEGSDITEAARQFQNVPLHINKEGTYVIDGEALIKLDDFAEINKNGEFKNSRNLAAGTLSSLDTSVVCDRKIRWYAWEVVEGYKDTNSFYLNLVEADALGFDVVPFANVEKDCFDDLQKCIDNFIETAEEKYLPQDGVVFKFDDVGYGKSLGNTSHHFNNGIAWKAANNSVETSLVDIEWSMGKTGILTPVAIFKSVEIDGSTVERASLHNISVMTDILGDNPWHGQRIGVCKRNLIIPQISWAEQLNGSRYDNNNYDTHNYINVPPVKCPICGSSTKVIKDNESEVLYCTNEDCHGRLLGKLSHAVSKNALNIDGLSESTIEKFIKLGWLNSIKDIYHLSDHEKEMKTLEGFGKKSVEKLLASIEKSRNTTVDRFLYSLSVPLLGRSASGMITEAIDYDFNTFMREMTIGGAEYFRHLPGVGNALVQSLDLYFCKHCSEIFELSKEFTFENPKSVINEYMEQTLNDKTFCVTGSLDHFANRDELVEKIKSLGGKVVGSVSSKTDYLINNDVNSSSSKNTKAKSLGIPIISEQDFINMIS